MRRVLRGVIITTALFIAGSCGVTRTIPEDQLLLRSVNIEVDKSAPKDERIPSTTLSRYIRQMPNKRLVGTNFYVWAHNLSNPDKSNWWNDLKRKMGEEPVYLNGDMVTKSIENLKVYMDSQGYYGSQAAFEVDTISRRRRADITYFVRQGEPYKIRRLSYIFKDTTLRELILSDTTKSLIHRGDVFSVALLDKERERITTQLRNKGYFNFTVRNISYTADTLAGDYTADLQLEIKQELSGYDDRGKPHYKDNIRYRLGEVNVISNFDPSVVLSDKNYLANIDTMRYRGLNIIHNSGQRPNVRDNVLRQMVSLYPNHLFNAQSVEQTYQNLMSLGYFKSARISFRALDSVAMRSIRRSDSIRIASVSREYKEVRVRERADSVRSVRDQYLSSTILCTPALRQSFNIELEGSSTSSFYGLNTTVGYQNRNVFRGAESWNIDFTVGYEKMKAPDALKTRATEFGVATGLTFPRFILPFHKTILPHSIQPKTILDVTISWQNRPYYNRTLTSASWGYTWRNRRSSSFTVRPMDINVINMNYIDESFYQALTNDYMRNSYETQLISGMSFGYIFNNQLRKARGNNTVLRVNAETAGNSINAIQNIISGDLTSSENYREILGIRYAQYARADLSISQRIPIGERTAVATRLYGGVGVAYGNSTAIPFDRLFYSGGSNSMRGWSPRTLGPGSTREQEDVIYPSQLGDMKLEANVEFRFPIWSLLHGATFLDLGNVWYLKDSEGVYDKESLFNVGDFYNQLGFNTGLGLRLDIQFAVLRLDWGVQLHNPNKPAGEKWVIKDFKFANTAINFGVGYPF